MTYEGMFDEAEEINKKNKQVKFLQSKCRQAGKRIKELEELEKHHKKLNGKLRQENDSLKKDVDRLSEERDNLTILLKK